MGLAGHGRRPWLAGSDSLPWTSLRWTSRPGAERDLASSVSECRRRARVGRAPAGGETSTDAPRAGATARQGEARADEEDAAERREAGDRLPDHAADLTGV